MELFEISVSMPVEFLFLYDNIWTAYDVQKMLENLRTYFGKEYGKELESKLQSGSGAVKASHSSWPYYKSPMFLKDQVRSDGPNVCNLTVEDDLDSACSVAKDPETPKKPVKKTTKKLTTEECLIKAAEEIVEKFHQGLQFYEKGQNWLMMNILAKQLLDN